MSNKVFNSTTKTMSPNKETKTTYVDMSMTSTPRLVKNEKTYKVESNEDVNAVKAAMHNLFSFIPGERVLDPEFGNKVMQYLYEGITKYNEEQIIATINEMVKKYEPRASIDSIVGIQSNDDIENNTKQIKIIWHVIGLDSSKYSLMIGI